MLPLLGVQALYCKGSDELKLRVDSLYLDALRAEVNSTSERSINNG